MSLVSETAERKDLLRMPEAEGGGFNLLLRRVPREARQSGQRGLRKFKIEGRPIVFLCGISLAIILERCLLLFRKRLQYRITATKDDTQRVISHHGCSEDLAQKFTKMRLL